MAHESASHGFDQRYSTGERTTQIWLPAVVFRNVSEELVASNLDQWAHSGQWQQAPRLLLYGSSAFSAWLVGPNQATCLSMRMPMAERRGLSILAQPAHNQYLREIMPSVSQVCSNTIILHVVPTRNLIAPLSLHRGTF